MALTKHFGKGSDKRPTSQNGPSAAALAAEQKVTALAIFLGAVASIGGFMFGYVR